MSSINIPILTWCASTLAHAAVVELSHEAILMQLIKYTDGMQWVGYHANLE